MATKTKKAGMALEAPIFAQDGKKAGVFSLPERLFGAQWNADLVHQVVVAMQANARTPVAHARTRGEVSGGGRKPWKQKGTGRARHGSTRSPIWRHGGKAHGPRNDKDCSQKVNKKAKAVALASVFSKKFSDGKILLVNTLEFAKPKAQDARKTLTSLGTISGYDEIATRRKNAILILLGSDNLNAKKSFGNFGNVLVKKAQEVNPVDLLTYKYVVIAHPEDAVKAIASKWN